MTSTHFLTRRLAAAAIRERGIPSTENTLAYLAHQGRGPAYSIVNGRAVYQLNDIDRWLGSQAAQTRCGDAA